MLSPPQADSSTSDHRPKKYFFFVSFIPSTFPLKVKHLKVKFVEEAIHVLNGIVQRKYVFECLDKIISGREIFRVWLYIFEINSKFRHLRLTHLKNKRKYSYVVVNHFITYFVIPHPVSAYKYSDVVIKSMHQFLIDNIVAVLRNQVFQQSVGMSMGANCSPLELTCFILFRS